MQDAAPVSTSLVVKHELSLSQSPQTKAEKHAYKSYAQDMHYLSLVGSLLFAMQMRPDIQYAVGLIAQFGANPGVAHLEAAKCILRYLKGTADYHLVLGRRWEGYFDLVDWSDSNWAQDMNDCRSTSGLIFDVVDSSIAWSSKKQATVATSSVEAEYVAFTNATKEAVWLHTLLTELDFSPTQAIVIHADNPGYITLANNPVSHSRAKHIDIKHHFIHEKIKYHKVRLDYVSTKNILADIFIKALSREAFEKFHTQLGVLPPE